MCSCHWPGSAIRGRRCRGCVRVKKFSGSGFGAGVLFAAVRAGSTEFFERPRLPILFVFSADSVAIPPPRLDVGASARTVRSGCSSPIAAARAAVADRRVLRIGGAAEDLEFVFPSSIHGHPIGKEHLSRLLHAAGIEPAAARNTALGELSMQLPAAVLSRLTGIRPRTATRWAAEAAGSGSRYAAALPRQS